MSSSEKIRFFESAEPYDLWFKPLLRKPCMRALANYVLTHKCHAMLTWNPPEVPHSTVEIRHLADDSYSVSFFLKKLPPPYDLSAYLQWTFPLRPTETNTRGTAQVYSLSSGTKQLIQNEVDPSTFGLTGDLNDVLESFNSAAGSCRYFPENLWQTTSLISPKP